MGTKAPLIRFMGEQDVAAVQALEEENFADSWSGMMLRQELANSLARLFVLEQQGQIVGYGDFWLVAGEVQLNRIAIAKSRQGRGLGKHFLQKLIRYFFKGEEESMTLEVRNNNFPAQRMYASLGFRQEGCRKDYYGKGVDALIMWLYKK